MDTRTQVSPPAYTEQNTVSVARSGHGPAQHVEEIPPPYQYNNHAGLTTGVDNAPDHEVVESADSKTSAHPTTESTSKNFAEAPSTSTAPASSPQPEPESSLSFMGNMKKAYDDKKKAKEAAKKVDFYEKMYGFVPKNVMSEAEWKQAKKDAPKVKAPNQLKATSFFGPR
ncbi:hypothetical protein FQN54_002491 [Arachnomyces sp. PD_36]|nr:hypothetical protein FQN54_002491 [Arachnomyces sp. PD_36]